MSLARPLLTRLYQDLAELLENPYPGVTVFTHDDDMLCLCLVLTPPSGPWKDLSLHFDVELPPNWPSSPPKISSSVRGIQHPNLFGSYICCDLLKEQFVLEEGYTGGYTPALTLRGLFLQFLTFFSSTSIEQDHGDEVVHIGDHILVHYVREEHLAISLFEENYCCEYHINRLCSSMEQDRMNLEILWNTSNSPEVQIASYRLPQAYATHLAKEVPGDVSRVHRIERVNPRWRSTYKMISTWQCKLCPYGSETLPVYTPVTADAREQDASVSPVPSRPDGHCLLEELDDDVLSEVASHLSSKSLIAFGIAYPRFWRLVSSRHILLRRELHCFFLRTPLRRSTLGIGVALDKSSRALSSDFDWLSQEAFDQYSVRKSIQKRDFQYFLPLAFSQSHFERARKDIWKHLIILNEAISELGNPRDAPRPKVPLSPSQRDFQIVGVIPGMMNSVIVSLMKSFNDLMDDTGSHQTLLHASEKAVIAYCHLFHLLLCLCRINPALLREATNRVHRFIQIPSSRTQIEVPDLGEFVVFVMVVLALSRNSGMSLTWSAINRPLLEEAIVRNVRCVLEESPHPEVSESGSNDYHLHVTFAKSRTSLRLLMFQISFFTMFLTTYASDLSTLDDNYGFAECGIPPRMVEEIKAIYEVETWPDFFQRVRCGRGVPFGEEEFSELLRIAIRTNEERGNHKLETPCKLHLMSGDRDLMESEGINARPLKSSTKRRNRMPRIFRKFPFFRDKTTSADHDEQTRTSRHNGIV